MTSEFGYFRASLEAKRKMDLKGIISISGKSGLFKMVGQMKNGLIVESITDGKRFPAYASHKVSALEDISIYGYSEDLPLGEIYGKLFELENGQKSLDNKASTNEMRDKLRTIFPEFDEERVYASDLKKLFSWYNVLLENDLLKPVTEDDGTEEAEVIEESTSKEEEE